MATANFNDSNILEAEAINWRLIIYPAVAALVLIMGGFTYYYYLQNEREQREEQAGEAVFKAKTPEQLVQVADQFPKTSQALLALLSAGNGSFDKKDYPAALKSYQRVTNTPEVDPALRDSAQLGVASTLEASGKVDDAIAAYLIVANRGNTSPYAPFAYNAVATIYKQRNDKANEQKTLTELVSLGADSPFEKEAEARLKVLNPPPPPSAPPVVPMTSTPPAAPAVNAAPAPAPAKP